MSTPQQEQLKLQTSSEEVNTNNQKSSQLVEKEQYPNTGFDIVGSEDHGYFVALGKYRLCAPRNTKAECHLLIETRDYELILGIIGACQESNTQITILQEQIDAITQALDEIKTQFRNAIPIQ